ncbi:MAG: SAF domain-containing protein [Pseudonocardiaceae bacterium]
MRRQRTLAPLLRERWDVLWRGPGFTRTLLLRRTAAALLVGLAATLALSPGTGAAAAVPVVVAARDLSPGTVLGAGEVVLSGLPEQVVPDGAARATPAVLGRTLAAPVRRGEPLTDLRLAGPELAQAVSADPAAVSVALRLPDPDMAALLHPGAMVDVLTLGERQDEPVVLASGARVLAVLEPGAGTAEGRLVLVALDAVAATRVAAASLSRAVTVTLR